MSSPKNMVFRLPTHLESFVPPPSEQFQQSRSWSGVLTLTFSSNSPNGFEDIYVAAAETDGDNRMDLWPPRLYVYLSQRRMAAADVSAWVRRHRPPVCAFMPDRHSDPATNTANQASFSSFSRLLLENQLVAFAPWNTPDTLPGAGIIIYPTQSSTSLLVGALFLSGSFPDFIVYNQQGAHTQSFPISHPISAPHLVAGPSTSYNNPTPTRHPYTGTGQGSAASYPSSASGSSSWMGPK